MFDYNLIKNEKTFFYTEEYLDYLSSYLDAQNCSKILQSGSCSLIIPCIETKATIGTAPLSYISLPYFEGECFEKAKKILIKDFLKYMQSFCKDIYLREDPLVKYDDIIIKSMLEYGYDVSVFYSSIIDLTQEKDILWKNLRQSYKSLINNVINNYGIKIYYANKDSDDFFREWIEVYNEVTSRADAQQSTATWGKAKKLFDSDKSFFIAAYLKKELVSVVEIGYTKENAYYLHGATKPVYEGTASYTHALLWQAIEETKSIGCKSFEIGPIYFPNLSTCSASKKELDISNSKLGMGGSLIPFHIYKHKKENNEQ